MNEPKTLGEIYRNELAIGIKTFYDIVDNVDFS